ncbi:MAG: alpha-amylase family glycosyl hydrolase [Candidatus Neomarinimicrobiota bacterium]
MIAIVSGQNGSSWTPTFPVSGDSLIITFNAAQNSEIPDAATSLVLHWGVNETSHGAWQIPSTDVWPAGTVASGDGAVRTAMNKQIGTIWQVTIPTNSAVATLHYVVNTGTPSVPGSSWGHNTGGTNWDITFLEPVLNAVILEPIVQTSYGHPLRTPLFAEAGETIPIVCTAYLESFPLDSLWLFVEDLLVLADTTDTLKYDFVVDDHGFGPKEITLIASDTKGTRDTSSIYIMVNPEVRDRPLPAGIIPGINYLSDTSVTLALFAPYKSNVYAIGDFSDWKVDTTCFMNHYQLSVDSTVWWVTIDGLTAGEEYAFQYLVNEELRIADPYTEKVLDPWNDKYIDGTTYPNLKPYPENKTNEPVSILQTGQTAFNWQYSDSYQRPPKEELIVYELLIRDFLAAHDYKTLIDTIDYLENLGVNAIELMPINEFEGNESWGYNPSFYFAPDKYYGPVNDLKTFIDECHRRGIAVILDMVLNHSFGQSSLVRLYWDSANNRPAANSPWFNPVAKHDFNVGYDINHESAHSKALVDRVNAHWITEYQVDGYRFDLSKGFMQTGSFYDYNAGRIVLLKRMADKVWEVNSDTYVILEHLGDNVEEKELANYGMLLWGKMTVPYNEATMGYHVNNFEEIISDFSWGYYKSRSWTVPHVVTYMESHDEERLMYKNLIYGNAVTGYSIRHLSTALNRMKLAAGFFLTLPGPKMIWQFGERGYDVSIDDGGRLSNKPPRWEYLQDPDRLRLYKTFQTLLKLRRENEVFRSPATTVELSLNGSDGKKRIRLSHSSMNVIILGNFGMYSQSITPDFYYSGTWYEYFSGTSLTVTNTADPITLVAGELRIYTDQYVEPPEPGLLAVEQADLPLPEELSLNQNYPNPFNPETRIDFALPAAGPVELAIYDLLGREISRLTDSWLPGGNYSVIWNGRAAGGDPVASGMYFYILRTENRTLSRKLLLLK